MNSNGQLLEALKTSEMYRTYERSYTEMTGMPVTLRPLESWQLSLHGKKGENGFCAMMAAKSKTCTACLLVQEKLAEGALKGPAVVTCAYGLAEAAVPLQLGSSTIGFLQTGQVMTRKPTTAAFERASEKAREVGVDLDTKEARAAYFATPVLSQKKLESACQMLSIFADHLSIRSNQLAVQSANAEPPAITRARKFIEEHYAEPLSLGGVARAVNMSLFNFCKTFKKSTGMTFTHFVSRTRLEKARNLLLNPNLRVSEIAFEVGFESLTHFKRIFKKLMGQSPSEYRESLPNSDLKEASRH